MSTKLTVEGMTCMSCEQHVVDALKGVSGVKTATADRTSDTVSVEGNADVDALITAVNDAGYQATQ